MRITTAEGAPLMEVTDVKVVGAMIVFEGKMMGGIPMKAYMPPGEIWKLLKMIWFRKALSIALLLIAAIFKSNERKILK
ncbi:MAG: hypothetical protein WC722_08705 [Rhodospirillales bacterium]